MDGSVTEVEVRQLDGGTFVGRGPSQHWVTIDSGPAEHGHDSAAGPMELVLMALGTCSGIDVNLMLKKMRIEFDDLRITMSGTRPSEPPRKYTSIHLVYHFWGSNLSNAKLERAVDLSLEKYCSVASTINGVAELTHEVLIHAAGDEL